MAISLTRAGAAYRAWVMAAQGLDEAGAGFLFEDAEELIDEAVKTFCERVAMSDQYQRVQNAYSVNLAGDGSGTLNDADMPDSLKPGKGGVVTSGAFTEPLIYSPNIRDLYLPKPGQGVYGWYAVRGGNGSGGIIFCADANGAALSGSVTVRACQYLTFATLPAQLEQLYLSTLAEMLKAKSPGPSPQAQ